MNSAAEILRDLEQHGHRVALDGAGRVIIRPALPQETADVLRARKLEIAEELRRRNADARDAEWRIGTLDEAVALHVARFVLVARAEAIAKGEL